MDMTKEAGEEYMYEILEKKMREHLLVQIGKIHKGDQLSLNYHICKI